MIELKDESTAAMTKQTLDLIDQCRTSQAGRTAYYRVLNVIANTGRSDGTKALINMLPNHLDRTTAHLYSPTDLRFTIDYEGIYPEPILKRAEATARVLTRDFERSNTDMLVGQGVYEGLKYGASILKQWVQDEGTPAVANYHKRLVMPWQFGVYREDENDLNKQAVMCESNMLSLDEVWRRIYALPDRERLYRRIASNAGASTQGNSPNDFFHEVLSTSQIQTGVQQANQPIPGGIVQLSNNPNYAMVGPQLGVDLVMMHELWVQGEKDYVTLQLIEPDILITRFKKSNALIPGDSQSGLHPYTLIQPNVETGYFWGRSELFDLIEPQMLLASWCDDIKRLFGLQIDKILGFSGWEGLSDEVYDQQRAAGYIGATAGATIADLTPKFPPEAIPMLKLIMEIMNTLGGFPNIMLGQGDTGVRSGGHANMLLKTASPRLRDRSLLVERQVAQAADLRLSLMEAKDPRKYWTDGTNIETMEKTGFLLSDLPEDRRVSVDSHSSSPIFADDHQQLVAGGMRLGIVDGESAIEMLPFPQRDLLKQRYRDKQKAQKEMMEKLRSENPEAWEKLMLKQAGGHR